MKAKTDGVSMHKDRGSSRSRGAQNHWNRGDERGGGGIKEDP